MFTRTSAADSFKFHVHVKVSSAPTSRQPKIIPLVRHHFSRRRWSFIANNNSVLANLLFGKPETRSFESTASWVREREATRHFCQERFYPDLLHQAIRPPSTISQLSFSSIRRRIFFPFEKRRVREKPRRGIVSLEYIQITGVARRGVSSPIRRGARNYFSGSIIPGYELYPSILWINLLVVYIPSALFSFFLPIQLPFSTSLLSSFLFFFPFPMSLRFSISATCPSFFLFPSFLPSSPSRFSATLFDYSVIAT